MVEFSLAGWVAAKLGTYIGPEVVMTFQTAPETLLETPTWLQAGRYDVDFVGAFTYLNGGNSHVRNVGSIGRFCAIAENVMIGMVEHSADFLSAHPIFTGSPFAHVEAWQARNRANLDKAAGALGTALQGRNAKIQIGNDVWIGEGAFIRSGTTIGDGAIIGGRAVVTSDVPPYAIVAGTPARILRYRFEPDVIERLLELAWWKYGLSALDGVDFTDIHQAMDRIADNIASGAAQIYTAPLVKVAKGNAIGVWHYDAAAGQLVELPS